ncbi:AEC family transporter [bacterium D16-51]|nr:AEC family transporter [bacterium D16-59]RKI59001.1 AEC family transporter [bacterium D16-51]
MDSFIYSLNATVPIFLVMVIGNFLNRIGLINRQFSNIADKLVFKICLPCMLFLNLSETNIRKEFDASYIGYCSAVTLLSILSIWFAAKRLMKDKSMVGAFVQGSYRSSAAILGLAFIENIYGTSGMAPLMMIGSVPLYNIFAVVVLTLENTQTESQNITLQLRKVFFSIMKNPIIIGIFLGLAASFFNLSLPHMIEKTVANLGTIASPLALLSIGASFEGRKAISKIKPTAIASFLKLIGLTALFLPVAIWLGFRDQKLIAIIIMLASPCTPTSYIMAKNMGGDASLASSIVVTTTLLSSVTLTGWIFLARLLDLIQ